MTELKRIENELKKGNSDTFVSIPFGEFPMIKWEEWNEDCKKNFRGCRWFKAYSDHLKAKNSEENKQLWNKITELEAKLITMKEDKSEDGVINLHGELIE